MRYILTTDVPLGTRLALDIALLILAYQDSGVVSGVLLVETATLKQYTLSHSIYHAGLPR